MLGNNTGIGWIETGEWVEYTVNVAKAGVYAFTFNTATPDGGRTITASFAQNGTVYATAPVAGVVDTVEGDVNGDGVADFQIQLNGLHNLTSTDFLL